MMSEVIEEAGGFRVRLEYDQDAQNPREDGDYHLAGVVTLYAGRYGEVADPAGDHRVQDAWARLNERYAWREALPILERYIRILGGVSVYESPGNGPSVLWYVLPDKWIEVTESAWDVHKAREAVVAESNEYRSWAAGDVYGYIVEKRTVWVPKGHPDAPEEMISWDEVASCWGFIGREWAEQAAREALSSEVS